MMKQFIYTLFLVLCINSLLQAQPFPAQIKYDKGMQPGLKLELPYTTVVSGLKPISSSFFKMVASETSVV